MTTIPAHLSGIRLSIGATRDGWYSIDNRGGNGADCLWDLEQYPWPLPDECAIEAWAGHAVNRINPARFGMILFFNEVWRILKPGGELTVISYYGMNQGYVGDPCAVNSITESVFFHFDPEHRSNLWLRYQPAPWRLVSLTWTNDSNIEACLAKR